MNITEKNILKLTKKILKENVDVSCLKEKKLKFVKIQYKPIPGLPKVITESDYYSAKDPVTGKKIKFYPNGTFKKYVTDNSTSPGQYRRGEWYCKGKDVYYSKMDTKIEFETIQ